LFPGLLAEADEHHTEAGVRIGGLLKGPFFAIIKVHMSYKRFQIFFFLAALVLSLGLTLMVFRPYLTLLAFGGVLAIITAPLFRYLKKMFKSEISAAFLSVLFIAIAVLFPLVFFLAALTGELIGVFGDLRTWFASASLTSVLTTALPESMHSQIPEVMNQILSFAGKAAESLSSNIIGLFSNAFSVLFSFLVVLISVYYLLKDGQKVKKKLLAMSPLADEYDELVFYKLSVAVRAVMGGVLIMGIIKGILAGFFFWIFGVPAPLFWGLLTGMASFVPVVGSAIITVPAVIYLLLSGHMLAAIGLMAVSVAIIGTVDNFLQPKLVESKTKIHPLLILLSILGGLKFFGFAGFILGPLTLSVTLALFDIYEKEFKQYIERMNSGGQDEPPV
jgi:predicted PurR-regulated permease PerM